MSLLFLTLFNLIDQEEDGTCSICLSEADLSNLSTFAFKFEEIGKDEGGKGKFL